MSEERLETVARAQRWILLLRGERVILDSDLAAIYGVPTKILNQAVRRNKDRFPGDFTFLLTPQEVSNLRSQSVTSSSAVNPPRSHGGRRSRPRAFTEHGAIMAAAVLNSPRAVQMSVLVVRAFVQLRQVLAGQRGLAEKVAELDRRLAAHDAAIREIVEAIKDLAALPAPDEPDKPGIGFRVKEPSAAYRSKRTKR